MCVDLCRRKDLAKILQILAKNSKGTKLHFPGPLALNKLNSSK